MTAVEREEPRIFTIGHSTHSLAGLVRLLRMHEIALVADVRKLPQSRRMPHFAADALAGSLPEHGIAYRHMPELGGFRRPAKDSPNAGWRIGAFRGYADYMLTPPFGAAVERLERLARERRVALMCAEALWWRCHRRLISDALAVRGWRVAHVDPGGRLSDHVLPGFAVVEESRITYPPRQGTLDLG